MDAEHFLSLSKALNIPLLCHDKERQAVCVTGAGGKTTLIFALAAEAKKHGLRVLITPTTKMALPTPADYDAIDLNGNFFEGQQIGAAGIYVSGLPQQDGKKIGGLTVVENVPESFLQFDLVLLEADGAAARPLKGWRNGEPVIPPWSDCTIGVLDISTIGKKISERTVHRLPLFCEQAEVNNEETITIDHLERIVCHRATLFYGAAITKLFCNKIESDISLNHYLQLRERIMKQNPSLHIAGGSLHKQIFFNSLE